MPPQCKDSRQLCMNERYGSTLILDFAVVWKARARCRLVSIREIRNGKTNQERNAHFYFKLICYLYLCWAIPWEIFKCYHCRHFHQLLLTPVTQSDPERIIEVRYRDPATVPRNSIFSFTQIWDSDTNGPSPRARQNTVNDHAKNAWLCFPAESREAKKCGGR